MAAASTCRRPGRRWFAAVHAPVRHVPVAQPLGARIRRADWPMDVVDQDPFRLPDVLLRQPPVVAGNQRIEVGDAVRQHAAREVDVRIAVAQREVPGGPEDRSSAMEAGVARTRHRAPPAAAAVDEDDVIELVLRLEAQNCSADGRAARGSPRPRARPRGSAPCRARTTPRKLRNVSPPGSVLYGNR